jgi:hypothetical protein
MAELFFLWMNILQSVACSPYDRLCIKEYISSSMSRQTEHHQTVQQTVQQTAFTLSFLISFGRRIAFH